MSGTLTFLLLEMVPLFWRDAEQALVTIASPMAVAERCTERAIRFS